MSYINPQDLKMKKRRHGVKWVTPEEAIEAANKAIDEANNRIAQQVLFAHQWQQVAADLEKENRRLQEKIGELERENGRLRKLVKPKAGKKRDEWELENQ